jgi:hypothetical protein
MRPPRMAASFYRTDRISERPPQVAVFLFAAHLAAIRTKRITAKVNLFVRVDAVAASLSIAPKDNLKCCRSVAKVLQRDATLHASTYWVAPHPGALFSAAPPESKTGGAVLSG